MIVTLLIGVAVYLAFVLLAAQIMGETDEC